MPRRVVTGRCHICGQVEKLSFEHVPPQKAFNDKRTIRAEFEDVIGLGPDEIIRGKIQQGGVGDYTLCERCNTETGSWYARDFIDWCYQGFDILKRSSGNPTLIYLNYMFPLRIIKQIVTMFFSINGPGLGDVNPILVKFVKNKLMNNLPPKFRFFVYYNTTGRMRYSGVIARVKFDTTNIETFSEFNFPPYGYVMTFGSDPHDTRLIEITHFSKYRHNDFVVQALRLPVLPTHLGFAGDYRSQAEIIRDREKNERYLKEIGEDERNEIKDRYYGEQSGYRVRY